MRTPLLFETDPFATPQLYADSQDPVPGGSGGRLQTPSPSVCGRGDSRLDTDSLVVCEISSEAAQQSHIHYNQIDFSEDFP